ncbi:hypothetical protein GOP47_0022218 [Adiantum capillus-veneris]|uniref:non-specific serine/threonine protein kinase n=1 Tax=Adiantum capillus-veneris TaxID=13818 RepID=A0A9D4Z8L2_ADICA|nr:hypothetical protein GOP47_0022218 [Adiantum capillus-veneris]
MSSHLLLLAFQLHLCMYSLLHGSSNAEGALSGLPSSVPLGTSFSSTTQAIWMQSQNTIFQLDLRPWHGIEQYCMGGVRYTYKNPNAFIWSFNTVPEPLVGSNCNLTLRWDGVLAFDLIPTASSTSRVVAWQTPTAGLSVQNLTLQDDGNLVLVDDSGGILWQSFEYFHHLFLIPSGMRFLQNITLYDRVVLYADFSMPGCYALRMGSQGRLEMFTRANMYVYHSIGINTSASGNNTIANYVVINQDIEFYSSQGTLMGTVAHNVLDNDPLPNPTNLTGSALFRDGNLMMNHPSPANLNKHPWYYNSSISGFCDFPLACGEYGLCNEATRECSCPPGFQRSFTMPACTATDEKTSKCSCPQKYLSMPKLSSTCIPVDSAYSLHPINVSFYPQPSAVRVASQAACRNLCAENASCNAALFDSNRSSCACFPILYTVALPSHNKATGQVMFLKITVVGRSSRSATAIIVSATIGGAFLISIVVCLMLFWRFRSHARYIHIQAQNQFLQDISKLPPRFTYKELEVATNNFSNRLGMGGYGSVYEGVLNVPSGIAKVAVKRLDQAGASALSTMDEQFKAEVATIGSVSHVNLVTLKGFCMEKNARLLVFEFMPRGSLDRWLYIHKPQAEESSSIACGRSSTELLDWEKRCRIALDTAKGLEYLHHQAAEHIVHCDVKPANILLADDFHAKVGDFGLAKLTGSDAQSFAMTTLKGTRGYLAPEWLQDASITAKSDVYSYGVVLLELLTGKRCIDPEYGHLTTWVMKAISAAKDSSTLTSIANSKVLDCDTIDVPLVEAKIMDGHLSYGGVPNGSFFRVLMLALACVQVDPSNRPSMTAVVQMLEDIFEISHSVPSLKLNERSEKYFPVHLSVLDSINSMSSSEISSW